MSDHSTERSVSDCPDPLPNSSPIPVIGAESTLRRRVFALVVDAAAIGVFASIMTGVTIVSYIVFTGDDFDGPASYSATEDWFIYSLFGGFAVVWSTCEIWFATSI